MHTNISIRVCEKFSFYIHQYRIGKNGHITFMKKVEALVKMKLGGALSFKSIF